MQQQIHFIPGLPRSGSFLLSGVLSQNLKFYAAMSSLVPSLMNSNLEQVGEGRELFDDYKVIYCMRNSSWLIDGF